MFKWISSTGSIESGIFIHKKGFNNYREISVTSIMNWLYGRILRNFIEMGYSNIEEKNGFRAGRSCRQHNLFNQIIMKKVARYQEIHIIFIYITFILWIIYQKAYDIVPIVKL
jgi:hypothetical protein